MKDQILRILLGTLFTALAVWAFGKGVEGVLVLVPGILGLLLLVRALPFFPWERWQAEFGPPQE